MLDLDMSILDIVNKAIHVRCDTGLLKDISLLMMCSQSTSTFQDLLLEGTDVLCQSSEAFASSKKEMLQLVNVHA